MTQKVPRTWAVRVTYGRRDSDQKAFLNFTCHDKEHAWSLLLNLFGVAEVERCRLIDRDDYVWMEVLPGDQVPAKPW